MEAEGEGTTRRPNRSNFVPGVVGAEVGREVMDGREELRRSARRAVSVLLAERRACAAFGSWALGR